MAVGCIQNRKASHLDDAVANSVDVISSIDIDDKGCDRLCVRFAAICEDLLLAVLCQHATGQFSLVEEQRSAFFVFLNRMARQRL